jgi:hypothetical protein
LFSFLILTLGNLLSFLQSNIFTFLEQLLDSDLQFFEFVVHRFSVEISNFPAPRLGVATNPVLPLCLPYCGLWFSETQISDCRFSFFTSAVLGCCSSLMICSLVFPRDAAACDEL